MKINVTPRGSLVYPHLNSPDTKFDRDGVYKTQLRVIDADAANELVDIIQESLDQYATQHPTVKKRAKMPFEKSDDGSYTFTFKCKARGIRADGTTWEQKPKIFDAKGNPFLVAKAIWGGTTAKVSFAIAPYNVAATGLGITLRLKGVQILELVEGGGSAETYGFSEEEGFDGSSSPSTQAEEVSTPAEEKPQEENAAANY
jgi:hypothetical protein